jgi:hypothetical protein
MVRARKGAFSAWKQNLSACLEGAPLGWLERRRAPVAEPPRAQRVQEAARLRYAPGKVWELITSPELAPVLDASIAKGFTVPGSRSGVGQQVCFIGLDGKTSLFEVLEYVEGRRRVWERVSPRLELPVRATCDLERLDLGCLLRLGLEVDAPPERGPMSQEFQDAWRQGRREYVARLKRALEE